MNQVKKETITVRALSVAFSVIALGVFKPFGLDAWQWEAYLHLLLIWVLGLVVCGLSELILKYIVRMPGSLEQGVGYIIRRNLWFQLINTPLVSLMICLYRHFVLSTRVEGNQLSWGNYFETLVIIAFCSFAIGLYWRFKFRSRYLAAELEETRQLNEQLKKWQASPSPSQGGDVELHNNAGNAASLGNQTPHPLEGHGEAITLEGTTNEHVTLDIADLLYIESVGNYVKVVSKREQSQACLDSAEREQSRPTVKVCQLHDNEVKTCMLRATMKQMEDALQAYPTIVRCHRAFLVNLGQVEQISSNSHAMQLVMRHSHDTIPVSRSNINKLKELLG